MLRENITLQNLLMRRRVPQLYKLASGFCVKGASRMRKNDLISSVARMLLSPERLGDILLMVDSVGWQLIQEAANTEGTLQISPRAARYARTFAELGYLQYEESPQSITVEMPVEIKELLSIMRQDGFYKRKERADLLYTYSQAAVTLYGIIDQTELIEIINRQNDEKTDLEELLLSQTPHLDFNSQYCLQENYLVNIEFRKNNFKGIPELITAIAGKPRYVPSKDTFLKYSNEGYYEKTRHTMRLTSALINSWGVSLNTAEKIVAELVSSFQSGSSVSKGLQILLQHVADQQDIALNNLVSAVYDTTRLWANKGYTLKELAQFRSQLNGKNFSATPERIKIGRNSPCPCGSGKKYKRCCGA